MILYENYSYKTFYYIAKDISNLDTKNYKLVKDMYDPEEFKQPDYTFDYDTNQIQTKGYDILQTKYGYFVYHYFHEIDEVREFLKQNSINKPCAVFGSHRVGDVYLVGIAENGEIKRLLYFEDGEAIIEGEPTEFEIQHNYNVKGDDFESIIHFFKEDMVFEYAKWFAGFDIETEDVEIQDMKYYMPVPFKTEINSNLGIEIKNNMINQKVNLVAILIAYDKVEDEVVVAGINFEAEDPIILYCDKIYGLADQEEIKISLKRSLNAISELDLRQFQSLMFAERFIREKINNKNCSIAMLTINAQKDYMLNYGYFQTNGKIVKWNAISQLFKGKVYFDLNNSVIDDICARCVKNLK